MFEPTSSLSLHRLSRHSLQDRYESDEEAVSESDTGAHDLLSSPVGSQTGIFDSDLSADGHSHMDPDSDRDEDILAPPTVKRARPVSSATIKRNSNATFDEDTYVFDPEEQMVLELPPSDSPPQLASSTFLQPSIYVWPRPPQPASSRSRSTSPSSVFSVEEADIQVAKEVTFMEPRTRPTVVLIDALRSRPKTSKSRPSHSRSRESSRTRSTLVRTDSRRLTLPHSSASATKSPRVSEKRASMKPASKSAPNQTPTLEDTQFAPSATINRVSEIPSVLYFPAPPRTVPTQEYRRPRTSGQDKAMPPPLNPRTRRPPLNAQHKQQQRAHLHLPPFNTLLSRGQQTKLQRRTLPTHQSLQPSLNLIHLFATAIYLLETQRLIIQCIEYDLEPLATYDAAHDEETLFFQRAFAE
ncbi:hypothetical protein N7530_007617 [Penicillium desertorum]|uniref:Uncharacterized protein n=1 Tax=Penicillium desertorum TaxID=1303715 RepID=A0A9W9WMK6_9EURO|nr:hypothetical protein N7530_007617 [Penicillium desertorum]